MQSESLKSIYRAIFELIDVGIHVIDGDGKTIIYNKKMMEIEGMDVEDVLDKMILDVFQFYQGEDSTLLKVLKNGHPILNIQQTYFNNKGMEIKTVNNTFPIMEQNEMIGAVEIVRDVTKLERMMRENTHYKDSGSSTFERYGEGMFFPINVVELGKKAALTNTSVAIIGDSGTGKKLLAECIHNARNHSNKPYIIQNCTELPETYIERVLFGSIEQQGLIEKAKGGTLVLEEIQTLPLSIQSRLVSVYQERRAVLDIKFIGTMSEDPFDMIADGKLLKELYYRLSEESIFIPPLMNRIHDIPSITTFLLKKYNDLYKLNVTTLSDDVMDHLFTYEWPGNVREIEHVIENAMKLLENENIIQIHHLPTTFRQRVPQETTLLMQKHRAIKPLDEYLQEAEMYYIQKGLQFHQYNITKTAEALKMSRQNLQYRMRKYRIAKP